MNNLTISVVIPTYQRPKYLEMAVVSLISQTHIPNEILIISRHNDDNTNKKAQELINKYSNVTNIKNEYVIDPGFLPPIEKGIECATQEIVAFLDDDAEAYPDWVENILLTYSDDYIGGVGGRCENYFDFKLVEYNAQKRVGEFTWYGNFIGNMVVKPIPYKNRTVDFFMGGNMSIRRSLLAQVRIDDVLKNNVSFHWEVDVCQQVKNMNVILIYNPDILIKHHTAPREVEGNRTVNFDAVYYKNFSHAYLVFKHLPFINKICYLSYTLLIGTKKSSGLLYLIYSILIKRSLDIRNDIFPSLKGRLDGIRLPNKTKF